MMVPVHIKDDQVPTMAPVHNQRKAGDHQITRTLIIQLLQMINDQVISTGGYPVQIPDHSAQLTH